MAGEDEIIAYNLNVQIQIKSVFQDKIKSLWFPVLFG